MNCGPTGPLPTESSDGLSLQRFRVGRGDELSDRRGDAECSDGSDANRRAEAPDRTTEFFGGIDPHGLALLRFGAYKISSVVLCVRDAVGASNEASIGDIADAVAELLAFSEEIAGDSQARPHFLRPLYGLAAALDREGIVCDVGVAGYRKGSPGQRSAVEGRDPTGSSRLSRSYVAGAGTAWLRETYWVAGDDATKGAVIRDIELTYRLAGLAPASPSLQPDELGVELGYMASLCRKEADAWGAFLSSAQARAWTGDKKDRAAKARSVGEPSEKSRENPSVQGPPLDQPLGRRFVGIGLEDQQSPEKPALVRRGNGVVPAELSALWGALARQEDFLRQHLSRWLPAAASAVSRMGLDELRSAALALAYNTAMHDLDVIPVLRKIVRDLERGAAKRERDEPSNLLLCAPREENEDNREGSERKAL